MQVRHGSFDRTRDHWWWRPGWRTGTRYLTFHLTFERCPEVQAEAERFAPALSAAVQVDPIPAQWLHLTMTGVGFSEDVDEAARTAVAEAAFAGVTGENEAPLVLDQLYVGREAVELVADAPPWLTELKRRQEQAVQGVSGTRPEDDRFVPHVSLAYFCGEADLPALTAALEAVGPREVVVRRPMVSLIELGRDDRVYTWRVLDQREITAAADR